MVSQYMKAHCISLSYNLSRFLLLLHKVSGGGIASDPADGIQYAVGSALSVPPRSHFLSAVIMFVHISSSSFYQLFFMGVKLDL
jgi:hypothetical protein